MESHTAKLPRQRPDTIKKNLPVRDFVKKPMQQHQNVHVEFIEGKVQLFKPVTKATKALLPSLEQTDKSTGKTAKNNKIKPKIF